MARSLKSERGFTLIELMVVVTIVGILAALASVSYRHFTERAKAVEAEAALAEIHRLELLYQANHGFYTDDFKALGFTLSAALKYYSVQIRTDSGGRAFYVLALPLSRTSDLTGLLLSRAQDGQVGVTKGAPITLAAQLSGLSAPGGDSGSNPIAGGGAAAGQGGQERKLGCRARWRSHCGSRWVARHEFLPQIARRRITLIPWRSLG
jgi:prepilin-type N-terminal cleavage/methylation domain-containing protein